MINENIAKFRAYRSKKLERIGKSLVKVGITADHITSLSFISGIAAMYFLFENYYLFAFFAILHLTGDALDGVVARLHKPTRYGKYFDLLSDSIVTFLALIKVGFYVQDFYPFIAAGLFLTALAINLRSGLQAPMFFMRTASLAVLLTATNPLFPFTKILLTAGYLVAGGVSLYSLAKQLQWFMSKR